MKTKNYSVGLIIFLLSISIFAQNQISADNVKLNAVNTDPIASADYSSSLSINLPVIERGEMTLDSKINQVNNSLISYSFDSWNAENLHLQFDNVHDVNSINQTIQDENANEAEYLFGVTDTPNSIFHGEIASNFSLSYGSTLYDVYFKIKTGYDNGEGILRHLNRTKLEIRSNTNNAPASTIFSSFMVNACIVVDHSNTDLIGHTIEYVLLNNPLGIIASEYATVKATFDVSLSSGNYWFVINDTDTTYSSLTYIALYDDGNNWGCLNKTVGESQWTDGYYYAGGGTWSINKNYDMYLKITYKITDELLATERSMNVTSPYQISISSGGIANILNAGSSLSFNTQSNRSVTFDTSGSGNFNKSETDSNSRSYSVNGDNVTWDIYYTTQSINTVSSGLNGVTSRNMTITFPSGFDMNSLVKQSGSGIMSKNGFDATIIYMDATTGTRSYYFTINGTSAISSVSCQDRVKIGNTLNVDASGSVSGQYTYRIYDYLEAEKLSGTGTVGTTKNINIDSLAIGDYKITVLYQDSATGKIGYRESSFSVYNNGEIKIGFEYSNHVRILNISSVTLFNSTWNQMLDRTGLDTWYFNFTNIEYGEYNASYVYDSLTYWLSANVTLDASLDTFVITTSITDPTPPPPNYGNLEIGVQYSDNVQIIPDNISVRLVGTETWITIDPHATTHNCTFGGLVYGEYEIKIGIDGIEYLLDDTIVINKAITYATIVSSLENPNGYTDQDDEFPMWIAYLVVGAVALGGVVVGINKKRSNKLYKY